MTTPPDDLPTIVEHHVHDPLTLLSLVREGISKAVAPALTRDDAKADVLFTAVGGNAALMVVGTDKKGERRFVEGVGLTDEDFNHLMALKTQYMNTVGDAEAEEISRLRAGEWKKKGQSLQKGTWISVHFVVEPDGFITKTKLNFDQPVFISRDPAQWHVAPEAESEDHRALWPMEMYQKEFEMAPRSPECIPDWFSAS